MDDQTQATLEQHGLTLHDLSDESVALEYNGERFSFPRRHLMPALSRGELPGRVERFMKDVDQRAAQRDERVAERQARVEDSGLPERILDHLDKVGITVEDLPHLSDNEIMGIPGIGPAALETIREAYPAQPTPPANDPMVTEEQRQAEAEKEAAVRARSAGEDVPVPPDPDLGPEHLVETPETADEDAASADETPE